MKRQCFFYVNGLIRHYFCKYVRYLFGIGARTRASRRICRKNNEKKLSVEKYFSRTNITKLRIEKLATVPF